MPYKVILTKDFFGREMLLNLPEYVSCREEGDLESKLNIMEKEGWIFVQNTGNVCIFRKEME